MHPDQRYIVALLNNDTAVIAEIYERFAPEIKRLVMNNSGDAEDARDIFQEALLAIAQRAGKGDFELTCPFGAYLFLICRSKWLNELKKRKNRLVTLTTFEGYNVGEHEDAFQAAQKLLGEQQKQKLFEEKFETLGERCRQLLRLSWSGVSMEEVAQSMSVTYGYARKKKSECIARLMELIRNAPEFKFLKQQ